MDGRRVIITGASGALGEATAADLRKRGATVVGLDTVAGRHVLACDVTDGEQVKRGVSAAVEMIGGLDALVHLAGIGTPVDAGAPPDDTVRRTLAVNLLGVWSVTAAALPALLDGGGRVVVVASGLAHVTVPLSAAYTVSKRGVSAFADVLRLEYGPELGVTTIYPGFIDTPIHDPSRRMGVSLDGTVPVESADHVVRAVLRAVTARRAPRDLATSLPTRAAVALGRHAPSLLDAAVRARLRRRLASGPLATAPLAAGLRRRNLDGGETGGA
ncbi:MAG: SDR family NAD(P)-dependent oxidoreductase [Carbonactinosporaceae bacterium]